MKKETTKDRVLSLLDTHKGVYYSGQELADTLSVSRTAVWKAIQSLRDEGYSIEGSTKLGYALSADTDVLSADSVRELLSADARAFYRVECVKVTDSTNGQLRQKGLDGAPEGVCLAAEEQTAGRGRKGRTFYSPHSTGLYLSVLLRPQLSVEDAVFITTAAAVAGARAAEQCNKSLQKGDVKIKWVNDLFLNGRKICGTLTEANFSLEAHGFDFAVLGIGFNLCPPAGGWPEGIENIAGTIFEEQSPAGSRNVLAAAFLNEFLQIYKTLPQVSYLEEYRSRQLAVGREVRVMSPNGTSAPALVLGVDDRCGLLVRFLDSGEERVLISGEISIRLENEKV